MQINLCDVVKLRSINYVNYMFVFIQIYALRHVSACLTVIIR